MKKALSMLLVLVMLIGMMPMQVFATEGTQETEAVEVVTEPSEAPEEETTAPAEETEPSEEIETEEPSDEEEETESPDEEEEEESSEPSEPEEEPEVVHEHDYEAVVTAPTCTEKGYTTYTCTCGDSYRISWLDESAYEGKTIACIGDSITAAVGVTKDENDYVKLLADRLSMNYIRLGASGTTLCTDGSRTCNIGRLTEGYLKNADIVTIAMGINDFCAAGEGYYELGGIISTDSSTIYGAVRMWCERIEELRATDSLCDTQFYFVTPVICSWNNSVTNKKDWDQSKENIHGYTLRDLCNAIIEVAELYDVGVIDLNLLSGMYYVDAENNNTAVFGGDGVHPGAGGHAMMANAIANALLQNNLRDDHAHTFGSWITTTWPSCTEGEQQRVCSVCSAVEHRSAEPAKDHTYVSAITVPTCTEQGYTTYTCDCGDSYVDDYVDATGEHTYSNGICTGCGEAHPNLANLKGKVISIMGDSISTFAGYIPVADGFNLAHRARYPQSNLLTDVNETWWMQAITALDAKLGINDSWAGSRVANNITGNSGDYGENAAMASMTRILNLGANGTPDVILFYGGTNDIAYSLMLGSFNPATAPTEVDLTATKWNSAADAYVAAILRMQHFYPNAKIIAMLPTYTVNHYSDAKLAQFNEIYAAICEHYGVTCIDLRDCGITTADLPDGIHPDSNGMDYITEAVLTALLEENMDPGETIVYSVKHTLTDVQASLGYYKGIRAGQTFAETLTGDNLAVTVMMGGEDITDTVCQNGEIRIASVTGDLVIMAKGQLTADGHLQQLPESFCSGTNLWTALKPENKYYTSGGWGNLPTNDVWSITIPVSAGDHIYASSFRKYGENGNNYSTDSGIRVTYFDANGALKTMTPTETYNAFKVNGYLTVPENVVAINIPMWTVSDENAVYILNKEHSYENGICAGCGDIRPVYEGHVQPLPDFVCSGMNLWNELEIRNGYYMETDWVDSVYSVTFAVSEDEQIWATSFQKVGINGGHVNGIRLTWFNGHGVIDSMEPAQVYDEFSRNGFLTAPTGAKYVNVVMWNNSDSNELYILNREHTYENGTCAGCGDHIGPVITQQPESVQQEIGKKFAITVKAEGDGLTYQWYYKESYQKNFSVSSNKTASYAYTMQSYMNGRQVYCVVTDAYGNQATTETATITLPPVAVTITQQPQDARVNVGERFSISPKVEGEGLTYQWYVKESGAKAFKVSSNKTSAYAYTMQNYMIGRQVYCVITDKYGNSVTTDVATISLPPVELKILTQPADVSASVGAKYSISPEVQGDGLTYQWYYKEGYMKDFKLSSNKTSAYAYSMQTYMNERSVYCVITDKYGNQVQTEIVTIHLEK